MFNCFYNDEGGSCGMMAWGWLVCQFGASAKGEEGQFFFFTPAVLSPFNVPFLRRPQGHKPLPA